MNIFFYTGNIKFILSLMWQTIANADIATTDADMLAKADM